MSELIALLDDLSVMSLTGFGIVAAAGLLMGVVPSSLPLISVLMGYVASHHDTPHQNRGWPGLLPSTGFIL